MRVLLALRRPVIVQVIKKWRGRQWMTQWRCPFTVQASTYLVTVTVFAGCPSHCSIRTPQTTSPPLRIPIRWSSSNWDREWELFGDENDPATSVLTMHWMFVYLKKKVRQHLVFKTDLRLQGNNNLNSLTNVCIHIGWMMLCRLDVTGKKGRNVWWKRYRWWLCYDSDLYYYSIVQFYHGALYLHFQALSPVAPVAFFPDTMSPGINWLYPFKLWSSNTAGLRARLKVESGEGCK